MFSSNASVGRMNGKPYAPHCFEAVSPVYSRIYKRIEELHKNQFQSALEVETMAESGEGSLTARITSAYSCNFSRLLQLAVLLLLLRWHAQSTVITIKCNERVEKHCIEKKTASAAAAAAIIQ